jgi:hypothetical protein
MIKAKEAKNRKENDPKTPTFRRHRESGAPEKIQGKFGIQCGPPAGFINIYPGETVPARLQT